MSSTSAPKSSNSALNRRSFLTRSTAIAAVPAVATLAGGALAEPASAGRQQHSSLSEAPAVRSLAQRSWVSAPGPGCCQRGRR